MISANSRLRTACALTISAGLSLLPLAAHAQGSGPSGSEPALSQGFRFVEMSGEELFAGVCRGCHMSDGKGAAGAAAYPSLAGNRNLQARGHPVTVVVKGLRGMPPFGSLMSDDQVAAVVNYLRTHFGNNYQDAVTVEDVNVARR
jgi:cytochrome c5